MKVNKRKKRERVNPEEGQEIDIDAFAEDGMVVLQFGDEEINIDPEQADELAEMIANAASDATEEEVEEEEE
jgi:hypothetical protein